MSFIFSIGPSPPISEIVTSHVYKLKKTRNEGDLKSHIFLFKRVRTQCRYTQSVKWLSGYSDVRDHEIYQE